MDGGKGLARHIRLLGFGSQGFQVVHRIAGGFLHEPRTGVGQQFHLVRVDVEIRDHPDHRDPGSHLAGKHQGLAERSFGQGRAVYGQQQMLEHGALLAREAHKPPRRFLRTLRSG